MSKNISRRSFIKKGLTVSAASVLSASLIPKLGFAGRNLSGEEIADSAVVSGSNGFDATLKAVELTGGMEKYVSKGAKVGILVNSKFRNIGTYVDPDVTLAAIKMIKDAGASRIFCIQDILPVYWERTELSGEYQSLIDSLEYKSDIMVKKLENTTKLREADVFEQLFDCDVFINVAIPKHHRSAAYTGLMKNMMGINTRSTNLYFHLGGEYKNDPEFLSQCIADLNTIRKPDLCIADMQQVITNNGPAGPGDLLKPGKVIAGKEIIPVDHKCAVILGHQKDELQVFAMGEKHGLGNRDYSTLNIKETSI